MRFQGCDETIMTYWGVLLANHRILSDEPPGERGPSHLASRCSTIFCSLPTAFAWVLCQLHWHLLVSSLLQEHWTAQQGCGLCSQSHEWGVVPGNTLRGESPTLGVQSQAWKGQVWLPWLDCNFWAPSFLRGQFPWGNQLLPAPLHSAWPGEVTRGLTWAEITWSHTWTICHTRALPVGLLDNTFLHST